MAAFLVIYDPSKGKEHEMVAALHRWSGARIFRGAWVIEFDSTADLARRALFAVGGDISCAVVTLKPHQPQFDFANVVEQERVARCERERSSVFCLGAHQAVLCIPTFRQHAHALAQRELVARRSHTTESIGQGFGGTD